MFSVLRIASLMACTPPCCANWEVGGAWSCEDHVIESGRGMVM